MYESYPFYILIPIEMEMQICYANQVTGLYI